MERRLIVEQFDPEYPKPGGIDTCIRGLIRYAPPGVQLRIAGVDAVGNKTLGEWAEYRVGGRTVEFMPVARLDHSNLRRRRPHSAWVALGLRRYLPAPDSDTVNTHRLNLGAVALRLYPNAGHVQYLHGSGVDDLKEGSMSAFRYATSVYRRLERYVIPRSVDVVVFNKLGAERLAKLSPLVRFSPNWFDPAAFYPADREVPFKSKILWPCRIEPQKNPQLAVEVMEELPDHYMLTVAGKGSLEATMRRLADSSKAAARIKFIGVIPKSKMGVEMREHHLLLMTSRFEGFPYSVVEGLASGLPVITTPGGEPNDLVKTGLNGARVPSDDPTLFPKAAEVASKISPNAAAKSVSHLSATVVVPSVMALPQ